MNVRVEEVVDNMKNLSVIALFLAASLSLGACNKYTDDISENVAAQKRQAPSPIEKLPEVTTFVAMKFEPKTDRMPFVLPKPEISMNQPIQALNCEQPDRDRPMEELEQFALDNLFMKGTITVEGKLKALVQTADGLVVRVEPGMHMGLNFGKVIRVAPDSLEVEEFISDGKGCWDKRATRLDMIVAD
ncbi:MAG: pilus assembly protein PilP [Succinivibrionaceae bacterium]